MPKKKSKTAKAKKKKMTEMSQTLYGQMEESAKLDDVIRKNLEGLGYGE